MKRKIRLQAGAAFALLALASPAEAAMRKCSMTPGFAVRVDPVTYLMVDQEIRGPIMQMTSRPGEPGPRVNDFLGTIDGFRVSTEDIYSLTISCLEIAEGDQKVLKQVIDVTTFEGAPHFLERTLIELAAVQEAWKTTWGSYAKTVVELQRRLPHLRPERLILNATDTGWSATMKIDDMPGGSSVHCHVAGGDAELPQPGMTRGEVRCFRS